MKGKVKAEHSAANSEATALGQRYYVKSDFKADKAPSTLEIMI